jgi:hypothetical protein
VRNAWSLACVVSLSDLFRSSVAKQDKFANSELQRSDILCVISAMTPRLATLCLFGVTCVLAVAQPPGPRPPSVELGEFGGAHLEKILAPLERQIVLPRSELSQLQQSFRDRRATAPENEKPVYQAAILVCTALSQAMNEREKAVASFQSSSAVHGSFDLNARRKDRPSWKDLRRERHEEEKRKEEAAQKDNFLNVQLKSSWQQRTIQLRQNIGYSPTDFGLPLVDLFNRRAG